MKVKWTELNDGSDVLAHGTLASGGTVVPWRISSDSYSTDLRVWDCDSSFDLCITNGDEDDVQLARDLMSLIRAAIRKSEDAAETGGA